MQTERVNSSKAFCYEISSNFGQIAVFVEVVFQLHPVGVLARY